MTPQTDSVDYEHSDEPSGGFSEPPVSVAFQEQTPAESAIWIDEPNAPVPAKTTASAKKETSTSTAVISSPSNVIGSTEKRASSKTYASLIQYDGPKVKSGITLEAEFIDDGSGTGRARVLYAGNSYVLDGSWTMLPVGKVEAPKLIEKKALNALRLSAEAPLIISRFIDNETVLECLQGETAAFGQRKGECQDNYGNKYHLVVRP